MWGSCCLPAACVGSQRVFGLTVTLASLLRGLGSAGQWKLLHFSWLRGHCGMCWAGILHSFAGRGGVTTSIALLSFWLGAGVPGENAGQFEDRVPAARIWQGQCLRSRLLPGTLLGHWQELGGLRGERGGRGAVGPAAGAGGQGGLCDGDGRGESTDLEVGGCLSGTFVLSHLFHGHVCWRGQMEALGKETGCMLVLWKFLQRPRHNKPTSKN